MASAISFGDASSGFQVGQSFAPITAEFHLPPERPETPPSPSSTVPFRRDLDFVERGEFLDRIQQKCAVPGSWTALVGLGSVGKSQLAIEYAHRIREQSSETWVFWVHASNAARFEQSYRDIAETLKVFGRRDPKANIFKLVHDWLRDSKHGNWVLILDNIDDARFLLDSHLDIRGKAGGPDTRDPRPLRDYLPQSQNGSILITSRSREAALKLVEETDIIDIKPMDKAHTLALFEKKLGKPDDSKDIAELATALKYMPLAIVQAAAYISQRAPRCSVRQYLNKFRKSDRKRTTLLNHEGGQLRRNPQSQDEASKQKWDRWAAELDKTTKLPDWDGLMFYDAMTGGCMRHGLEHLRSAPSPLRDIHDCILEKITTPPLSYDRLDVGRQEIRLTRLLLAEPKLPGLYNNLVPIETQLQSFPFDQCPQYTALSYSWNSSSHHEDNKYPILINGYAIDVTESLWGALHEFQTRRMENWFWIDAICIDQKNDAEKSEQVQRMRIIYSNATRVIGWLGPYSDLGLKDIKKAAENISSAWAIEWTAANPESQHTTCFDLDADMLMDAMKDAPLVRRLASVAFSRDGGDTGISLWKVECIFYREFFSRVWIIQEVASAQDVVLIDGDQEISLKKFFITWAVLYHHLGRFGFVFNEDAEYWSAAAIERSVKRIAPLLLCSYVLGKAQEKRTLFELLRACGDFDATDPRDKVYALLGIANDAERLRITVDYSKSPVAVFTEVAKVLIREYGVNILSFNAGLSLRDYKKPTLLKRADLPTWCPDWTLAPLYTLASERFGGSGRFSAARGFQVEGKLQFSGDALLCLPGIRIGSISATSALFCEVIDKWEERQGIPAGSDLRRKHIPKETRRLFQEIFEFARGLDDSARQAWALEDVAFAIPIAWPQFQSEMDRESASAESHRLAEAYQQLRGVSEDSAEVLEDEMYEKVRPYLLEAQRWASGKMVFRCGAVYLGLAPWMAREGDLVVIFFGGNVPYVLRPLPNGRFQLVGEAYVYGVMHGECSRDWAEKDVEIFVLE